MAPLAVISTLIVATASGCVTTPERIARIHAECRSEAKKAAENPRQEASLEEACLERRRPEWEAN